MIRRRVYPSLSPHLVLNLEYRKSERIFCISRNRDSCFLREFLSGTLLAQKHHKIAGLSTGHAGSVAWPNGYTFPTSDWFATSSDSPRKMRSFPRKPWASF
jgi:hypothetical protein